MNAWRIVLLLVALLAGGLAAYLATRADEPVEVVEVPAPQIIEEPRARILVAKAPIGVGQQLSADSIEWQDWPLSAVRPEYITIAALPDALTGMMGTLARFELFPGEPILESKLVRSDSGYLSAVLAKGMRGISVSVTADAAAGGFIFPNDRVDVVLTRETASGQVSETILTNVRVLAVGKRLGETGTTGAPEDPEDPKASIFTSDAIATLELNPAQGELIINSARIGSLSLALRSITDYAVLPGEPPEKKPNAVVRVIGFGIDRNVRINRGAPAEPVAADAAVADAEDGVN